MITKRNHGLSKPRVNPDYENQEETMEYQNQEKTTGYEN